MRTRILAFATALVLAALGAAVPVAQAAAPAVTGTECKASGGTVEYISTTGLWTCLNGGYNGELITER
ncbi:hypothetical protein [Streptomyces sp. NRRL S-237]|uniref:hypothetical protein n=1 Tax=Streptomyces sp. NRRL S-237 TaxID=1463895 RepID=UPI0004CA1642|nr:hypothetical protein [Streptomyces sp. NRRL S-237]